MVKIGVMTDLHLGVRPYGLEEREIDFYDQYMFAVQTFIDNNTEVVVLGGDIFDQPRPSPKALRIFSDGLKLLFENDINVLNIIGNHAMIQTKNFITADEFLLTVLNSDKYRLLDRDYYYQNDNICIMGLPYYFNYQLDDFIKEVDRLNTIASDIETPCILVLHQAFKEYCGFTGEKLSIDDINIDNFDLIICGHIHEKKIVQYQNTVFLQPGSIERLSVAEAKDEENNGKGIFIFDSDIINLETISNGFIWLKNDRQFLISDMYMKNSDEVLDIKNEILDEIRFCRKAPILFLNVHDSSNSFYKLMDLTKELKEDCLTVNFNYFDESIQEPIYPELINNNDVPPLREVLRIGLNPLEPDEAQLGLDLFDLLKDDKDVSTLLDDFLKKRRDQNQKEKENIDYSDDDIDEILAYFEEK